MTPRVLGVALCVALFGALFATTTACEDPPPPPPRPRPHRRAVTPPAPPPAAPPLERPRPKVVEEDPAAVARHECGQVYQLRQRSNEQMRRILAQSSPKTKVPDLPPREQFVAHCAALPLAVIRCMNPQKAAAAAVDCVATLSKLDAKALERLRNVGNPKGRRGGRRRR